MRHQIETHLGVMIDVRNPKPEDIQIEDIAHSLARECRYGNFVTDFYSVAQHSCLLAKYACNKLHKPPREVMRALMHDSPEAYIGDWPHPIKNMPEFKEPLLLLEENLITAIETALDVPVRMEPWLHDIDRRIVCDERAHIKNATGNVWLSDENEPLGITIDRVWGYKEAKAVFLGFYEQIKYAMGST